jgi:carbamoyl-phosphate synthase large subunit
MRKILVSGASGIVGYGILRSLRAHCGNLILYGSSIYGDSVAPAFCDVFERAPSTSDEGYGGWLLSTINRYKLDMVIPGIEADVQDWAGRAADIRGVGAIPMLNNLDLIALCKDKWAFYERMKQLGSLLVIESSLSQDFDELVHRFGLPFLLKPRQGYGSKGIVKIDGRVAFDAHRQHIGRRLMAQPIVGIDGEEYSSSAFCDGHGSYSASLTLRRTLSRDGYTHKAEVVAPDAFSGALSELCRYFRPLGPTNFQFRKDEQGLKLLEINPRISSATAIRTAFGYNESGMAVDFFLANRAPSQPAIRRGKAVRYTDEQIFYEDSIHL